MFVPSASLAPVFHCDMTHDCTVVCGLCTVVCNIFDLKASLFPYSFFSSRWCSKQGEYEPQFYISVHASYSCR